MTLCIISLYSLQIPVSAAEEGKGWLVREKRPGCASANSCQSTSHACTASTVPSSLGLSSLSSTSQTNLALPLRHWARVPSLAGPAVLEIRGNWRVERMSNHWAGSCCLSLSQEESLLWGGIPAGKPDFQSVKLTTSFITCIFPEFFFFFFALTSMQHDLIHHFWWSNRFQSSDFSPWFYCSAASSLPDLHLMWKTSLSQPFLTLALSPDHPMSPDLFDRNPTTCSLHTWSLTPPGPPEQGRTTARTSWLPRRLSGMWAHVFLK